MGTSIVGLTRLVVLLAVFVCLTAPSVQAQVCPADNGVPCDSPNDADLCTDGVIVCTDGVPICRNEGARIWLPADEGSGGVLINAADAPRQADAAVGAAISWTNGDTGLAVLFDGSLATSWVRVPKAEALSTDAFTWAFKVLPTSSVGTVVSRTSSTDFDGFRYEVDGTITIDGVSYASPPLPTGFWRQVTIVVASGQLGVWHDGSLVGSFALSTVPASWVSDIWFGQDQDSHNGGFQTADAYDGLLDDIVYYPRGLTASEVLDLYGFGVPFQQMHRELCDGVDNDCNPSTPDVKDTPCDGPDSDKCTNGVTQCGGGVLGLLSVCGTESTVDILESCNFLDDDCDGVIDNGTGAGTTCDGPDADSCAGGRYTCNSTGGTVCGTEPVAFYDFDSDEAGLRTILDSTSWNHEAAMFAGATYDAAGHSGRALKLDGSALGMARMYSSDAIRVAEWTFSAWVQPTSNVRAAVLYQRNVFAVWRNPDGSISVSRGSTPDTATPSFGTLPVDEWSHLLVSVDDGTATVYVNGTEVGTSALSSMPGVSALIYPTTLGCVSEGRTCQSHAFTGLLDDAAFFNRPLNASEAGLVFGDSKTWFVPSRERCGVVDGDCNGETATTAVGCTNYYNDADTDGFGDDPIGGLRPSVWWSMDEVRADGALADWSSHDVPLVRVGATRRGLGHVGFALDFDGVDRTAGVETASENHSWTSFGPEWTFSAWVMPRTKAPGGKLRTIVSSLVGGWKLVIASNGRFQFRTNSDTLTGPSSTLNTWQHIAISIDGTTVTFYKNGLVADTEELSGVLALDHGVGIGNRPGLGGQPFDGLIDEVTMFP